MSLKTIIFGGEEFDIDYIANNNLNLPEIKKTQLKLLNVYRLTEEFKEAYRKFILSNYPNGQGVKYAIEEIKKFKKLDDVSIKTHGDLIVDMMYSLYVLGFQHYEYFCYDLENKTIKEKIKFISNNDIMKYYKLMNKDKNAMHILGNKYLTYENFKDYYKRDILNFSNIKNNREDFIYFCKKHQKFMIKPIGGALGKRIEIIDIKEYKNIDEVFFYLLSMNTNIICEELIVQSQKFKSIHESSVNTIRIFSYCKDKTCNIVCAWLKAGKGKAIVDNGGSGGMLAAIDIKTGVVATDARDEGANTYEIHPDTGFKFKGFKIDKWNELKQIVKELAKKMPSVPMIGWDFAYSEEKGWQLIEGNEMGQIFLNQIPLKKGMKEEYEKLFEWEKWNNN